MSTFFFFFMVLFFIWVKSSRLVFRRRRLRLQLFLYFRNCLLCHLCAGPGRRAWRCKFWNLRFLAIRISWLIQPSHPFQNDSSSVSSLKVTGTYPSSVFIFITAAPEVRLKILAFGQRRRARVNEACLMRFASTCHWNLGWTNCTEMATYSLIQHDSM